ncbi:MAG: amino acid ABC transporter permease [Acholeplasmataceae bacterium]
MNRKAAYALAILTLIAFMAFVIYRQDSGFSFQSFEAYQRMILIGTGNTIYVSLVALMGSLVLGFVFYLLSIARSRYFNALVDIFTEIIYGTPLLVMIIIMAFLIGPAFNSLNRNAMGFIALIIYMTPYMKNVYKAAFSSISKDQYLAMDLFGFTPYQRYRYIIIPQVIRILMPPLMNNFSMIIKGSALLSVLSFNELFYAIRVTQSKSFAFNEGYILMWGLYLLITIPLSQATRVIERKWAL